MSQQLSLNLLDSEPNSRSLADSDSELKTAKFKAIQRYLNNGERDTIACVNKYRAGNRKNHFYYRLSYREGLKMKHLHIPGGNTQSELANYRAQKLQAMIDRSCELEELIAQIADFRSTQKE